jgi:hypothetical protein
VRSLLSLSRDGLETCFAFAQGVRSRNDGLAPALFQLFFHDPNGIKIELNFDAAEAEGVAPELMASELIRAK